MLITRRREGEAVLIDGQIEVRVLEIGQGRVKLGIRAPGSMTVERKELQLVTEENQAALETMRSDFARSLLRNAKRED